MHVFLAGGSGAIGRRLTPQLVARGHKVTATTTSQDKLDGLRALGAEPVVVDGLDAVGVGVGEAVARTEPDAVIHQMSALAGEPDLHRFDDWFARTNELRTAGTEILLAAARATGVKRFVAQSYTGWPNTREGGPVKTEEDPHDSDPPPAQAKSLAAIRTLERAVLEAPLEGIVLRYGSLYGPGASDGLDELVRVSDWLPYLAEEAGAKPPRRLPVWVGRMVAGEVAVSFMTRIRGSSNAKAKRELGWEPSWRSWREGFRHGLTDEAARAPRAA